MNEYVTFEMARMQRAEQMQDASNYRRARAGRPERAPRRIPFISRFRSRASEE